MAIYLRQLLLGPMDNFVYLLGSDRSADVAVVDPAWDLEAIEKAAQEDGKRIACVFASHCHLDHINALPDLLKRHDVPVYVNKAEAEFSPELRRLKDALRPLDGGASVDVGGLSIQSLHTPGHTPGSQCLLCEGCLVSGDTVFIRACGRCDLKGGDPEAMYRTITQVLMKLPEQTKLFPGHHYADVPVSTLGDERRENPYFQFPDLASFVSLRMRPRR